MTKTELKNRIEKTIDALMEYKLDEMLMQSINEAQADADNDERTDILKEDYILLDGWLKEFEKDATVKKVNKAENKKALIPKRIRTIIS